MKNLQGVVSFVESAAHGSFTAAASRLELTPAAVSKNVQRLEQQLQVRLFNRTTRRLTLTAEGAAFADSARQALRALDDAVSGVSRAGSEAAGRVRISVGMAFGRRHVLPALPAIAAAHPALELELSLENRPVDLVAEGYDIGIRGGFIRDSSLVARRVCRLPVVLVASPGYLAAAGVPASPGELARHQLLGVRPTHGTPTLWRFRTPAGKPLSVEPPARLWASDPEALVDLALAGAGICQTGLHHVVPHLQDGRLKVVLGQAHDADEREIVLHYPHRQFLSTRVRVVVDTLLQHLAAQTELHLRPQDMPLSWRAEATPAGGAGTPAAAASTPPHRKRSPRR
jgi:DNA-binding transcriptional LysR family regulator